MNNDEAKFILAAYRPNGQDATDPLFSEPLAQARRDLNLKAWFNAQLEFDSQVSAKLREIQPPPGLRNLLLAGTRVSRRPQTWRQRRWFWFLAVAAVFVISLSALVAARFAPARPELAELTQFALRDTAFNGEDHYGSVPAIRALEQRLAESNLRSGADLNLDLARLRADGCRTVRVAGREVFEICFGRDHEFHLYVAKRGDFASAPEDQPEFATQGRFSAATWADGRSAYSLVTNSGENALRQRL